MSYSLGFVFVASGLIIAVIAFTMIAKQERLDLHGELKAVPRTWAKRNYVAASVGLDDPLDVPTPPLVSAPRDVYKRQDQRREVTPPVSQELAATLHVGRRGRPHGDCPSEPALRGTERSSRV